MLYLLEFWDEFNAPTRNLLNEKPSKEAIKALFLRYALPKWIKIFERYNGPITQISEIEFRGGAVFVGGHDEVVEIAYIWKDEANKGIAWKEKSSSDFSIRLNEIQIQASSQKEDIACLLTSEYEVLRQIAKELYDK